MKNRRMRKHMLIKIIIAIAALGIISFGMLMGYVWMEEKKVPSELSDLQTNFDAVIVLGAQVQADGTPSVQLSWRLDRAFEVWQKKQVLIVVCGAQGKNEPEPEADTMKKYLEGKGIPADMILTDPDSFNTEQNLTHAKLLLDAVPDEVGKVLIVTSDYHVPRAMALAEDIGLEAEGIGSPCLSEYWIKNHSREALAWVKYWMNKYFHLNL